jgi:hypothetical protein
MDLEYFQILEEAEEPFQPEEGEVSMEGVGSVGWIDPMGWTDGGGVGMVADGKDGVADSNQ